MSSVLESAMQDQMPMDGVGDAVAATHTPAADAPIPHNRSASPPSAAAKTAAGSGSSTARSSPIPPAPQQSKVADAVCMLSSPDPSTKLKDAGHAHSDMSPAAAILQPPAAELSELCSANAAPLTVNPASTALHSVENSFLETPVSNLPGVSGAQRPQSVVTTTNITQNSHACAADAKSSANTTGTAAMPAMNEIVSQTALPETPHATSKVDDATGIPAEAIGLSVEKARPGRKRKALPPGFTRVDPGEPDNPSVSAIWIAPDKTKCTLWRQVESWMLTNRPTVAWAGQRQAPTGQTNAAAIDEAIDYEAYETPRDVAEFMGFLIYYLTLAEKEDEVFDLLNRRDPNINGVLINLCDLYHIVDEQGGMEKMGTTRAWKSVLQAMKLSASTEDARAVQVIYERFLQCCENKAWNDEELKQGADANRIKANLKTLMRRRYLKAGQRLIFNKAKAFKGNDTALQHGEKESEVAGTLTVDGKIDFEGSIYNSPNAFALAAFLHLGQGNKSKAPNLDGWTSVGIIGKDNRYFSLSQIKREYTRALGDNRKTAMTKPQHFFAGLKNKLLSLKNQAEMREQQEAELQRVLENEKRLAAKPPPCWIPPEDDKRYSDEVENGTRTAVVDMHLEKLIVGLETATAKDDLDVAEEALKEVVDTVMRDGTEEFKLTHDCISVSPLVLNRLTKCCWAWVCKSSFVAPHGKWQMNLHVVEQRLRVELNPRLRGRRRSTKLTASSIGSQYSASRLPPNWRREEREPPAGIALGRGGNLKIKMYTYFAPDGKTFTRWPDALAYFVETEQAKSQDDSKGPQMTHEADGASAAARGEGSAGGDKQALDVEEDEDEDEEAEEDEDMGEDEGGLGDQQQQNDVSSSTGVGHTQLWCTCCRSSSADGSCKLVQRDQIFGHSNVAMHACRVQAERYRRLAECYILVLKLLCRFKSCLARVGSHGPSLQLLIEIISAELPAPNASTSGADIKGRSLELLIALAHVINLKVAPGKRLLKVISSSIKAQGTSADANGVRYKLVHLLARLADCPHNKQVMVEQEHEVLPTILQLMMFPHSVGGYKLLSMALDAVHRFSSFGAIPSVLRRLNGTPGCIGMLVRIVGGAYEPHHCRKQSGRSKGAVRVFVSVVDTDVGNSESHSQIVHTGAGGAGGPDPCSPRAR